MIDYSFRFVEDVIFYVGKHNMRSQKAVEKIGGKRIIENHLDRLVKISETDWTYRINFVDWKEISKGIIL
jgi:hypothetical protein